MVLILFSSILIIPVLIGWGKMTEYLSGPLLSGIAGKVLLGIFSITFIWTGLSFLIPLNIYVEITTILLGLISFFKEKLYQQFYSFSRNDYFLVAVISMVIAFSGSCYPYILDHFGYYVPSIKWITEYGLIKGISNLDLTLGQMSAWHIFQAGFSNFSDPFLRMNAILLIIYTIYIIEKKNWVHLCFIPVLLLFSQSPSPDLPVIIFSLIILNEILVRNKKHALLFCFSVFVFTIKPTMIWLPVLSFLYSISVENKIFKKLIPGIILLCLFFFKNIWTFGYPVFPVPVLDLGIAWKPHPEILKISSQYAIQKTYDMQYSYQEIQQFSWFDYIKNWLFLKGIKSIINIVFIISLIVFIFYTVFKKDKIVTLLCIALLVKSTLVLLFSAQYRFFIDVFFVVFFILFREMFNKRKSVFIFIFLSIFFIGCLSLPGILQRYMPSFRPGSFMGKLEIQQIYKPSEYHYNQFDSFEIGNLKFNVSEKYPYNFDTELPSISSSFIKDDIKANIFPQLIDEKNIQKGFIWRKMNIKEKKQAQSVIQTIKNSYP